MTRLLIVDDSALMRKLLEELFRAEQDFEIRLARSGAEALALIEQFDPHVVTLDVQMPGMDGLTCLSRIMIEAPRPVVMISSLTAEGADATLEAIELGAVDFVAKPHGAVSLHLDRLRPLLVEKVRGAARARIRRTLRLTERIRHQFRDAGIRPPRPRTHPNKSGDQAGLILVGTSTGGPAALDIVLPWLPSELPWPIVIAQHMPAAFTGPLARRLNRQCALDVVEVTGPMPLRPGTVYIGRGDADLILTSRSGSLVAMPAPALADYPWHPSVERLVTSALDECDASKLIGVLMTGMGRDGANAMTQLRKRGGRTIAEAESSAVVWGMPGELVRLGGADYVRPVDDIAPTILELVADHAVR